MPFHFRSRRLVSLGAVACTLAVSTVARSQPTSESTQACMDAYVGAQQLRKNNDLLQARVTLATCADPTCPSMIQTDCNTWLGQVSESIPTVLLDAKLGGDSLLDASVSMDGKVIATQLDGKPVEVNPGLHAFVFTRGDLPPIEKKVIVVPGARSQVVAAEWAVATMVRAAPPADVSVAHTTRPVPPLTYVLGGTAVVGLGVFAYLGLSGNSTENNLKSTCSPHCYSGDVSSLKAQFIGADIVAGVSVLAAAGAVATFLARPTQETRGPSISTAGITPLSGGAALFCGGSF